MDIPKELLQKKILIIDDVAYMRNLAKTILRDAGFTHIFDAGDGEEALALMAKVKVNLAVCDWNMPGMSGLELFKAMQEDAKLVGIPFIILTSSSEGSKVKEALQAGISAYILKPFKPDDLVKKILSRLK